MIILRIYLFIISVYGKKPNIVFVLVDDLGWSDVSWNNGIYNTTPFMDNLLQNATKIRVLINRNIREF